MGNVIHSYHNETGTTWSDGTYVIVIASALNGRMRNPLLKQVGVDPGHKRGRMNRAYSIPMRRDAVSVLESETIRQNVAKFLVHAEMNPDDTFYIDGDIGDQETAQLFALAPPNCVLPRRWEKWL